MANWTALKAAIAAVIKTNGNKEITGAVLQSTLNSIVSNLGENATFKGVAIPTTAPGTPDGNLFYIATQKGTYTNFGGLIVGDTDGMVILLYSSQWTKINIPIATKDDLNAVKTDLSNLDFKVSKIDVDNKIDSVLNGVTSINQFVGIGTPTPISPFINNAEGTYNPKVENVIDTESPFKDILGYYTKISNTKSVSATSFLSATNDFITSRPNNIKFSFFTKKSDWDAITAKFLFGFSLYSYAPTILFSDIKFDIKNVIAGNVINTTFTGSACDGNFSVIKAFDKNGFCQILVDINITNWKLSAGAGIRPIIQLSNMQSKWVDKSFLMVNQQLVLDNVLQSGVFVYPDINNVVKNYYPGSLKDVNERIDALETSIGDIVTQTQLDEQINKIYVGIGNVNQINQIGTSIPGMSFLQNANENPTAGGYPKVENVIDTESPFKDILGYLTRFTNTQTSNVSNYKFEATEVRINRPTLLSIGFWVKKSQFTGIGFENIMFIASYTHVPVVLVSDSILISQLVDGNIGVKITNNVTSDLFDSTREMYKAFEVGDWCQIIVNYKSIVWDVADGTKWKYGFGFNNQQTKWVNQSKDYANFQISEGKELPIGINVIDDVAGLTTVYPQSFDSLTKSIEQSKQEITQLDEQIQLLAKKPNKLVYNKNDNANSYIQSPFNDTHDFRLNFVCKRSATATNNPCFNFLSASLVNKSTLAETVVHSSGDDITPANYNGTYIGANHGCSDLRAVTANNHGKTFADIGSEWSNGTYKFYIIGIIDVNTLWILGENSKVYPLWTFRTVATGNTLTHVSGATNTTNIVVANSTMAQFYPSLYVSDLKLLADGIEIKESGTYNFDELNICEIYDVFNVASTLEKIKSLVGTFVANPIYNQLNADKVARHSLNYKFISADKCLVNTNFVAYQNIEISYFGFMQQGVLSGNNVKMYIPKALPIMDGATQKDFRTIVDHNVVSNTMDLVAAYWENPLLPPDRYIQASENVVFNGGYLFDYGIGGTKRKDLINNAFFLYTSRKVYPHGIDSKITVNGGSKYNAVCFRVYTDVQKFNVGGIINQNAFEYEGALYVYADFNNAGYFEITIPDKYIGKLINVLEKSTNVDVLSETSNSKILVKVNTATPLYGYLVIKLS